MKRSLFRSISLCGVGCILSACGNFFPMPSEPIKKYTLEGLANEEQGEMAVAYRPHHVIVDTPSVYSPIDSTRIALKPQAQAIDYYADVEWADRLSALLQESLIYSLQNKGGWQGVSRPTEGIQADYALKLDVRKFYIDQNGAKHGSTAHVDCLAYLVKLPERHVVACQRFTQAQAIPEQATDSIVKSLNMAWQDVSKALASWVLGHAR